MYMWPIGGGSHKEKEVFSWHCVAMQPNPTMLLCFDASMLALILFFLGIHHYMCEPYGLLAGSSLHVHTMSTPYQVSCIDVAVQYSLLPPCLSFSCAGLLCLSNKLYYGLSPIPLCFLGIQTTTCLFVHMNTTKPIIPILYHEEGLFLFHFLLLRTNHV